MKKIILIIFTLIFITGCNSNKESTPLMESNDFKDIVLENVTSLEIIKYTIDGREELTIDNYDEIEEKYNYLNNYIIGEETNKTCEDNTIIYKFIQNDKTISIEIECNNILVIDNNRFELIKE